MVYLDDILNTDRLGREIADGYVRVGDHPYLPLNILCYEHKAMIDQHWTHEVRMSRGLIYDGISLKVVARPFEKFFNHGEEHAPEIPANTPVKLYDKIDGSLGIVYPIANGKYAVATKGSFTSEQAARGTEIWRRDFEGRFRPPKNLTILVEIVYPENRIVLDYGKQEKLILLGAVDIETGLSYSPEDIIWWPGEKAEQVGSGSWGFITSNPDLPVFHRPNREGVVAWSPTLDVRVKLKQEDYIEKHKAVFGLNEKAVWDAWDENRITEFINGLPEEVQEWARETHMKFWEEHQRRLDQVADIWESWIVCAQDFSSDRANRAHFANWVKGSGCAHLIEVHGRWLEAALFAHFDRDYLRASSIIRKSLKPHGQTEKAKW
jgi:RNA ligase